MAGSPHREPYALERGEGRGLAFANGNRIEIKLGGTRSGGRLTFVEGTHLPHTGPALHVHDEVDEAFYVLEGSYAITCGEERFEAGPGSFVFVPQGTAHRFEPGDEGGRMLLLYAPGGFDGYFEERQRGEAEADGELGRERLEALAAKFGMRFAG